MKLKVPPVVVLFLSLGIIFGISILIPSISFRFEYQTILSRVILALGVLVAFSGVISFRLNGTTVDPTKPSKATSLVTKGIYNYTRNPMYLGMAFILAGGILRIGNPLAIVGLVFFIWYLTRFQIKPEENALKELFGKEYEDYCGRVRRWI